MAPEALLTHYLRHGRAEGRFPTRAAYLAHLAARHGDLPEGFNPGLYRDLNPDLADRLTEDWQSVAHYLADGRAEQRRHALDLSGEEADFARRAGLEPEAGREAFADFLRAHGLVPGRWLLRFDLDQFGLLNADWIEAPPATRAEGIRLFAARGIARLAPIAADAAFDPAFYRAVYGVAGIAEDAALYRHWLSTGIERGWVPNEAAHVTDLIGEAGLPACFDAETYRASLRGGRRLRPSQLLAQWLETGFPQGRLDIVSGPGAAAFLTRVGEWHRRHGRLVPALRAFDEALARGGPTARRLHGRAEILQALGEPAAAEAFAAAAARPEAGLWSQVGALQALAAAGDLPGALTALRAASARWSRDPRWREAALAVLRRAFDGAVEAAREAYRAGRRPEGDAILEAALHRLEDDLPRAEPLPAPLPAAPGRRLVMLANLDLPQCVHYRVEQRRRQLAQAGWEVEIFGQGEAGAFREALPGAAAALFYRVPAFPDVLHAILYARALGLPTVYDIDDLVFDPIHSPGPYADFEGQISPEEYVGLLLAVPLFRFALSRCEEGFASTPALAEAMRPLLRSGRCHLLRNGLDERNAPFLARPDPAPADPDAPVTLFYGSGTRSHNRDFTVLAGPALLRVMTRHKRVRLVIAGHLRLDPAFAPVAERIHRLGFTPRADEYWEALSAAAINLAVLLPGAAADAKSEIKWLEAAVCGVPSVVSGTRTHREVLADGEDALIVDTPEAWEAALERLVTDPDLRRRIGLAARRKARRDYGLAAGAAALARALPGAARPGAPALAGTKPRILLVNVFFPPQTIGGATRVVADNLDRFLDAAGDRLAFAVAASDEGAFPRERARIDAHRGVPVLRIGVPAEPGVDWRPFNPRVGEVFGRFLDHAAPDLVHLHCVQRLTASVLEEVQARGLPHLVTVHDGWWISDHQFLLDRDGRLVRPAPVALPPEVDAPYGAMAQVARRQRLARLLSGADRVLAVSESFARLYREAGIAGAVAVPNGLSLGAVAPREPGRGPRVRLGHVGGREAHKGAPLVEAVLRTTPTRNLSLTLVDFAQDPGSAREEVWGTTPVTIVGPVAPEAVPALYRSLDVLLAPSRCAESFGLVSREARAFGLWVVASDRGAMGEEVRPGIDGFVIDVGTAQPLREVLAAIDDDPARYCALPPPAAGPVRRAADQADDLLRLYDEILAAPRHRAAE
ncbi:glycosyltransferase [Methylobacterium sp. JK268]